MTLRFDHDIARLEGVCGVAEAEPLFAAFAAGRVRSADLSACRDLHAAVAQVLVSCDIAILGVPEDGFLRDLVAPALQRHCAERRRPEDRQRRP